MKFIFFLLAIIQVTFAQNPANPGISQQDANALHNAFVKLFSNGAVINNFALKLEQRNGLDDQTINNIANVVIKEVSEYISSIASTIPNSASFVDALVNIIQEFDVLQQLLNTEGYNDEGVLAYVSAGVYNDVVNALKKMAEPFVHSIRQLQGNTIAPPKPTMKPDQATIEKFRASLTKIHQNVLTIYKNVQSTNLISENGLIAASGIIQKIDNLIQNMLKTLDPEIAANFKAMINDIFAQIIIIMDVYEEYKGIDESKIIMQLVNTAYRSVVSSFYKLELQAEKLPNSAPPAHVVPKHPKSSVPERDHQQYHGIPPPPPQPSNNQPFVHQVQSFGPSPMYSEDHESEPSLQVHPPSIPVGAHSGHHEAHPVQNAQRIQQLKRKTDHDIESLISLIMAINCSDESDSELVRIFSQTLQQIRNLVQSSLANQPDLITKFNQILEAIFADIADWGTLLQEGNQSIKIVFAELVPKIFHDIFNYFYSATMHNAHGHH